jgi:hypothetical protein
LVTFGDVSLSNVLSIQITNAHEEIERVVPGRTISYRADKAQLGRTIKLDGEIRETTIDAALSAIEQIRTLNDGVARSLVLEDGTAAFNAQLVDPIYDLSVENWLQNPDILSGKFTVPYSVVLLEVE